MKQEQDRRLDEPYAKHKHAKQVAELVDQAMKLNYEQRADFTLTLLIEGRLDLVVAFDELVKREIASFDEAEYASLVNFIDTMMDKAQAEQRVARVSINGQVKKQ